MTNLELYNRIIDNFQSMSLKESLIKEHVGTKKFYALMKDYPEETKRYLEIVQQKKSKTRPNTLKSFNSVQMQEIKDKYIRGWSLEELTREYKTSSVVLKRNLRSIGVVLRDQEGTNKLQSLKKCAIKSDDQWKQLYNDYLKQRSLDKVCSQYRTSVESATRNLKRLGLPLIKGALNSCYRTKQGIKYLFEDDWTYLYEYYKTHSISQTVEYCGLSRRRIYHIFKQLGYKKRNLKEERELRIYKRGERSFNELKTYLTEYTFLEPFKGYTKNGKYLKYEIKHNKCGRVFKRTLHDPLSIRCSHCYPKSKGESFIYSLLNGKVEVIQGDRSLIPPQELDFYIPRLKTAIEFNGRFWHNEEVVPKNYHVEKTEKCLSKGIKLYHFWEGQKREIIESKIYQILGLSKKLYARKTEVRELALNERRNFFNTTHISGDVPSLFALGLFLRDELVAAISFRKHKEGLELARYANGLGVTVVGGFSKLFKHSLIFISEKYSEINKIISYCNRDWTPNYKDSVYFKSGFEFKGNTGSIMTYYNYSLGKTESREKYQKHKLRKLFHDYKGDNVNEFLKSKGILRMYNSGNWKFEWRIDEN